MARANTSINMWSWLTASTINLAGNLATTTALPIVVYQATRSANAVSMLTVIEALPYLALGLPAGQLADHRRRRSIIIVGFMIAAMVAAIQAIGLSGGVHLYLVYFCAMMNAVVFVGTDAADFGFLPQIVTEAKLPRTWGIWTVLTHIFSVLVPAVTAPLLTIFGAVPVLTMDSMSFLLAAVLISRLKPLPQGEPTESGTGSAGGGFSEEVAVDRDWRAGLMFIWDHRTLRPLVLAGLLNSAAFGAVTALLVVFAVDSLGLPPAGAEIGAVFASSAAGGVAVGVMFDRMYSAGRVRLLTLIGTIGSAGSIILLTRSSSLVTASVVLTLYGAFLALTTTSGIVFRQEVAPEHMRSRVMTVGRMIAWGGQPLGAATAGTLATLTGVRTTYLLSAALFVLAFAIALRIPPGGGRRSEPSCTERRIV